MARNFLVFLLAFLVAVLTCLLTLWLVMPRLLPFVSNGPSFNSNTPSSNTPNSISPIASPKTNGSGNTANLPPITATGTPGSEQLPNLAPPISKEQQEIAEYERQRAPLYTFLREKCGLLVVDGQPALDDRATLSLYCTRSDSTIVTDVLTQIVKPYVYSYGFRHVRFYLPTPRGQVERWHLAAEAQAVGPHSWQAFEK